jgi:hypothetical protein
MRHRRSEEARSDHRDQVRYRTALQHAVRGFALRGRGGERFAGRARLDSSSTGNTDSSAGDDRAERGRDPALRRARFQDAGKPWTEAPSSPRRNG